MQDSLPLRPFREPDLAVLDRLTDDPQMLGPFAWSGWSNSTGLRRQWEQGGLITEDGGVLALLREDVAVGMASWRAVTYAGAVPCWNIGACVLPEERRTGAATAGVLALTEYLFAHTRARRVEAHVEVGNTAAPRVLDRAGFVREGVARGAAWRAGRWRDLAVYAVLRDDRAPGAPPE